MLLTGNNAWEFSRRALGHYGVKKCHREKKANESCREHLYIFIERDMSTMTFKKRHFT